MNPTPKTGQTSGGKAEIGSEGACVLVCMCVGGGDDLQMWRRLPGTQEGPQAHRGSRLVLPSPGR